MENFDANAEIEKGGKNNFAVRLKTQFTEEFIDRMIAACDVDNDDADEYTVLGGILVRAGYAWRCVNPRCRGINHLESATCDNCRSRKSKSREVPVPESYIGLTLESDREKINRMKRKAKKEMESQSNNVLQCTGE